MSDRDDTAPSQPFEGLTYGSYLKVPELLDLQHMVVDRSHDEHLFIVIHQAYELWFKQVLYELDTVVRLLRKQDWNEATHLVKRVVAIERVLVDQIHILETMRPRDFCHFRGALRPASGFQSVQFREVEFLSGLKDPAYLRFLPEGSDERAQLQRRLDEPTLGEVFFGALRDAGIAVPDNPEPDTPAWDDAVAALLPIYAEPDEHAALYRLCEALVEHDEWIGIWRYHHVRVVERIIGSKYGTGGSHGVRYLESTLSKRALPVLWAVRTYLDESSLFATYQEP